MCQQNVLGLQIAMNDTLALQHDQGTEHLSAEATNEWKRESLELICLDELVQIHSKKFSRDTQMAAEVETLDEVDHAVLVIGILFLILA
jgi:hypothetical protein